MYEFVCFLRSLCIRSYCLSFRFIFEEIIGFRFIFFSDSQGYQFCGFYKGSVCFEFKFFGYIICVEVRVIQSDIENSDGYVLQVFVFILLQMILEGVFYFLVVILIFIYLQRGAEVDCGKRVGEGQGGRSYYGQESQGIMLVEDLE